MALPPAPQEPTPSVADIEALANQLDQRARSATEEISAASARQDVSDRARLAATVSTVFLFCLPVAIIALLVLSFVQQASAAEAVKGIVEILKSVLLPIVTLVLGYYFARGRN